MKYPKIILYSTALIILFLLPSKICAEVHTVSNHVNSPGEYNNVQDAIDAAALDDTIYVHGSPIRYQPFTINKRLVLIGAGYYVTGTQQNFKTTVNNTITFDSVTNVPVSGSKIMGFETWSFTFAQAVNNVVFERNRINSQLRVGGNNWIIRNSFISQIGLNFGSTLPANTTITNNVIGNIAGVPGYPSFTGIVIVHNFIYGSIGSLSNAVISDNIFQTSSNTFLSGNTNSTISNNITYGGTTLTLPTVNNSGSNNLNNTTPLMVNVPLPVLVTDIPTYNFTLLPGSPGINAASDGTNIGPTGGTYPMAVFDGVSWLPQMTELNIANPSIAPGQQLNVNFKARKHQ